MNRFPYSNTSMRVLFLICFPILILLEGCNVRSEQVGNDIRKSMDNTIKDGCRIIQNENLDKSEKIDQLNNVQVQLDSLSKIWDNTLSGSRAKLSENEIDQIENENRLMSEELIRTIIREMPEYKELLRENLIYSINE